MATFRYPQRHLSTQISFQTRLLLSMRVPCSKLQAHVDSIRQYCTKRRAARRVVTSYSVNGGARSLFPLFRSKLTLRSTFAFGACLFSLPDVSVALSEQDRYFLFALRSMIGHSSEQVRLSATFAALAERASSLLLEPVCVPEVLVAPSEQDR